MKTTMAGSLVSTIGVASIGRVRAQQEPQAQKYPRRGKTATGPSGKLT